MAANGGDKSAGWALSVATDGRNKVVHWPSAGCFLESGHRFTCVCILLSWNFSIGLVFSV